MSKPDLIQGSNPVHGNEPQEVGGDNEGGEAQEVDDVQQGPHIHSTQISIMKSIFNHSRLVFNIIRTIRDSSVL